ncbi:PH domain-containing protein DDB_G0275795-like isoform X2 [Hydractinia symbiolongicarpus]|uniref:PH domain-containing protein DDB_G0275795-like isoform X2 n=1 Tax=Hydractinia symbiolongicarpus TaxID=13093 RepID=UPI00254FDB73|nr:PH domain-containing protein DDB_G0275795-like isoform X2 [Hydractinia symbiolongicarpus]
MGCSASTRRNAVAKDQPVSHNRGIIAPQEQKLMETEQREASGKYEKLSKKHSNECKIKKQMEEKQIKNKSKHKTTPVKVRRGSLSSISSSSSEEDDYSPSVDMKKIEAQNSHAVVTIPIASNVLTQDECLDTVYPHQETLEEITKSHEEPTEIREETIETHKEANETREDTIETHEEANETREETIETHEEPTETRKETIETHENANQVTSTSTELSTVTECQEPPEKAITIQDIKEVVALDEVEINNGDVLVAETGEETKFYDELASNQKEECIQEVNDKDIESIDPTDAIVEGEAREQAVKNDQDKQEGGEATSREQHVASANVDTSSVGENDQIVGEKNDEVVISESFSNVVGDPIEKVSEMNAPVDASDGNVNKELSSAVDRIEKVSEMNAPVDASDGNVNKELSYAVSAHQEDETAEECTRERNEDDTNDAMKVNKDETNGSNKNISASLEEGLEINTRPTSNLEVAEDGEVEEEA